MPRFRFTRADDSQVDPFNAGDPVMPGDEPWADDEPDPDEDAFEAENYEPHGEEGGTPHKAGDDYRAPTKRGRAYDAPSIDEEAAPGGGRPLGPEWQRAADEARGGARRRGRERSGCIVALVVALILFSSLGGLVMSCVSTVGEGISTGIGSVLDGDGVSFDDYVSDDEETDWHDTADKSDLAAGREVERRIDALLADPSSGELHERVASYLDGELAEREGYTAAQLGIDADAWATWVLSGVSWELSSVYTYDDGTGSAYFDMTSPDVSAVIDESGISSYLIDHDLSIWSGQGTTQLTDAQRAEVRALWEAAMEQSEETSDSFLGVELIRVDGVWTVDEATLWDALDSGLGL